MINLARICIASSQKPSIMLVFSMIWFKSFDFHQVHDFSIHHFNQVHHSLFQMIVFEICHTDEKFSCMSTDACEIDTQVIIVWLILIKFLVHHLLIFIKFTIFKFDFHQVHHSNFQMQLFEISHTDEKFSLYVNQFIRKRHSSLIVDIIDRSASIESNQIRSNRSNQIKSNQIKSDQIKHVFIA
jgi:hypothetical protein